MTTEHDPLLLPIQPLTPDSFAPYGWLLGDPPPVDTQLPTFSNAATDFWQAHVFDPGTGGESEFLWVNYRDNDRAIATLEVHWLTQQAIVPLTGDIIQVVATGDSPDLASLRAFRVPVGRGICMRPGCWHATRVAAGEVNCLMSTRRSTTVDLIGHLVHGRPLVESALARMQARIALA
jgi:ureidoglycolate lyase